MVILPAEGTNVFIAPSKQDGLANILVSEGSSNQATIVLLRPLHVPTDLPCMPLVAPQLAHQMRIKWLGMDSFGVGMKFLSSARKVELDGFGSELVSQLVKGSWTRLASLSLPGCGLKAKGFWLLSQGSWPRLENLNVSCNCLDAQGMALLAKGNWPLLTSISLNLNPAVDATAIACLSAANWPIQSLMIKQASFGIDMAAALVDLQLSNLTHLHLDSTGLTAAAVIELARADWPSFKYLGLGRGDLKAVGVLLGLDLHKIHLQRQSAADLSKTVHEREVNPQLGVGLWPNLTQVMMLNRYIYLHV